MHVYCTDEPDSIRSTDAGFGTQKARRAGAGLGAQAQRNILGFKRGVTASLGLFIGRVKGVAIQ